MVKSVGIPHAQLSGLGRRSRDFDCRDSLGWLAFPAGPKLSASIAAVCRKHYSLPAKQQQCHKRTEARERRARFSPASPAVRPTQAP
jgi:hypothetical protein